jgi:exodeoxyribonuclease VII large subunit
LKDIYTVSRLNREVRTVLEGGFPLLWVEGEISNLARPGSGHWYFSLKDEAAQVRCAMFRNRNMHLGFTPQNGMNILVRAKISLYEARGEFQLIVEHMEEAGTGALQRAFEALKQRLDKEGLFATQHKQPLPEHPQCVGVITSATGAAIRDILTTLQRRFPALPVILYPVPVQGEGAADKIADAIRTANERNDCDVLIVARGGGSLEDLWAFNEEVVARAIFNSSLPIVSGVGHEIDFTIADFVADRRAPTPTAAAEMISPDQREWLQRLVQFEQRLVTRAQARITQHQQNLDWLRRRLPHPGRRILEITQRLDELELRLRNAQTNLVRLYGHRLNTAFASLKQHNPATRIKQFDVRNQNLAQRLSLAMQRALHNRQQQLKTVSRALQAVSPLATLSRGYAIVTDAETRRVIHDAGQVSVGSLLETRLQHGRLLTEVKRVIKK